MDANSVDSTQDDAQLKAAAKQRTGSGRHASFSPKHHQRRKTDATHRRGERQHQQYRSRTDSSNKKREYDEHKRENVEHESKIPYFLDEIRERDRIQRLRSRRSLTPKSRLHKRSRSRSKERNPAHHRHDRYKYSERNNNRRRPSNELHRGNRIVHSRRYSRSCSRSRTRSPNRRQNSRKRSRSPRIVTIPVPVPVDYPPFGYQWVAQRQGLPLHHQPYCGPPAPPYFGPQHMMYGMRPRRPLHRPPPTLLMRPQSVYIPRYRPPHY